MPKKDESTQKKPDAAATGAAATEPDENKEPETSATTEKPKTYTEAELQILLGKAKKESDKQIADAAKKAKMDEDERTKAERDEAIAALRERDTRDAVIEAAEKAGVKNPRLFYNAYKSELESDDKGKITNLKEVLETAKTESAELFTSAPQPSGSADAGEGKANNTGSLTREAIDKMSPDEIVANMDKIDAFLASQK